MNQARLSAQTYLYLYIQLLDDMVLAGTEHICVFDAIYSSS